jgi:hypothetical protein
MSAYTHWLLIIIDAVSNDRLIQFSDLMLKISDLPSPLKLNCQIPTEITTLAVQTEILVLTQYNRHVVVGSAYI